MVPSFPQGSALSEDEFVIVGREQRLRFWKLDVVSIVHNTIQISVVLNLDHKLSLNS